MLTTGGMTGRLNRLDRLERAGHVQRAPDPHDRRALLVSLTTTGRRLVDEAVATANAVLRDVLASVQARAGR
ncbi:hypothetical protein [uncultured Cellulomonas sp.]|uniref:hypothetical protein n=1 Tax=uncultured Cellulomonas sp. TaxID=189682 RepID=UPI00261A4140|nr:hypothetical protein [uncultured Cellulomonas sp.]